MAPKSTLNLEDLHESIANIFDQAQVSLANHKKNCVALYKLHTKAAAVTQPGKNGNELKLIGEKAFQDVFIDMVNRVLVVKKGPANADRIVKYVGSYVKFMNEKVSEEKSKTASSSSISLLAANNTEDDDENATTRFVSRLLNWLLQGFVAKNKNVRYRCIHIVSEMISHLGEIDEDAYNELRDSLIQRLCDKESLIRVHVVIALSKLVGTESPDEIEQGERTVLQTLLDIVSTDPAAEVRRAALVNIPLVPTTLDVILSRARDVDPVTRKLVYNGVLQSKLGHPRQLSIAQREQIVKDGLGDREQGVRVAAGKLVASWFDTAMAETPKEEESTWDGDDGGVMKGLIHFLSLFDVVGPGEVISVDAVLSIFTTRPDIPDVFIFKDEYWKELTLESVVLARVFVEHCISTQNEARLESASLPVVTAFAFHIQEAYNALLVVLQDIETAKLLRAGLEQEEEEEEEELEEELAKREVILGELLRMALKLDYSDEIGRRKVFSVVKDMLGHPQLPPGLIERCLDVLKEIMPSERDLIRVIVEIIVELREGEDDVENADDPQALFDDNQSDISQVTVRKDKSLRKTKERQEMTSEERMEADVTDIRCLLLCIAVLERVDGSFEDNSTLEGILGDLIIPSVKRKELAMREKALVSLGLCCLIAKNMALSSFQLFLSQAQNAPTELKVQVLRIILDLLIVYDQEFFSRSEDVAKRITDFLLQMLDSDDSPEAQAVLCTGICKLLLAGIIIEPRVLSCLALMYISPATRDNQELRQCLSYFFPVYSYSSPENQNRVQEIFISTFDMAARMHEDLDEDQEMVSLHQFGLLMLDWTNPQKAAEIAIEDARNQEPHVNLAANILTALYDSDRSVDEQKTLCQLLGQLQIESGLDLRAIQKINILLSYHEEQCPFENSSIEKIFDRFKNRFSKIFADELKKINPLEYVDDEFRDVYQRIGVDVPAEGDDENRRSRSRNKQKAVEDAGDSDGDDDGDDEQLEGEAASDDQIRQSTPSPPPKPKKPPATRRSTRPTRSTSRNQKQKAQEASDSQLSGEENIPPMETITVTPKKKGAKRMHAPGSGALNSPANRKKTRVKGPPKSLPTEATPTNTDIESPPTTPTKRSTRQSRSRKNQGDSPTAVTESSPASSECRGSDNAAEVEFMPSARRASPSLVPSSDDFGGY